MYGFHRNTTVRGRFTRRMASTFSEGTLLLGRCWVRLAPLRRYLSDPPFKMANTSQELLDLFEELVFSSDRHSSRVSSPITVSQPGDQILHTMKYKGGNLKANSLQPPPSLGPSSAKDTESPRPGSKSPEGVMSKIASNF